MRQVAPDVQRFRTAIQVGDADIAATVAAARVDDESRRIWLNQRMRIDGAAGNTKRLDLYAQFKAVADSLLADDEAFLASKAKIEAEMAGLLKPLPATGAKLTKAVDAHEVFAWRVRNLPEFDTLESDPRYQALLRRMNFPE